MMSVRSVSVSHDVCEVSVSVSHDVCEVSVSISHDVCEVCVRSLMMSVRSV